MNGAVEVLTRCAACRWEAAHAPERLTVQHLLMFKRVYLLDCERHLAAWMDADRAARRRDERTRRVQ